MRQAKQNYETIMKHVTGKLSSIGIKAEAEIVTNNIINHISSAGIWGIEQGYKDDKKDLEEIENDQLAELHDILFELGFNESDIKGAENKKEYSI